ncbi:hypothetical protein HNP65_000893 [Thermosipho japonicus]|uniref:Uncharacterized protein n=1 Tax=Thermosipho japonicus TaxID=90323 RepID=A0A841GKC2_9BACT|nr:hypothetical protein [Thermosipho japonicus]MBB6062455.1 hypothetical protein [Thermosipho japonicus]
MKNLIATACNQKYEQFLYNDWLMSLKDNVNLNNTDILVIDFGLSSNILTKLKKENVLVKKANTKGNIVNARFIELYNFLINNNNYKNLLFCDSGDIIFQNDISKILNSKIKNFLVVCEDIAPPMSLVLKENNLDKTLINNIKSLLHNKKMINAGVIFGNKDSFISLLEFLINNLKNLNTWGLDQLLINYYLYKHGFEELEDIYNFIPTTHISSLTIKNGKLFKNNELIYIVHNAGNKSFFRPLKNFGYSNKNKIRLNRLLVYSLRIIYKIFNKRSD